MKRIITLKNTIGYAISMENLTTQEEIMALRVAINGFGRIGRNVFRASLNKKDLEFVAVNDLTDSKTLAHLLTYDSVHGKIKADVSVEGDYLIVNGRKIRVLSERDMSKLPWKELGVDVVLESTGLFTDRNKAAGHLDAGAKKVIISAPSKNADTTIVLGVNQDVYDPGKHDVISMGSCTTNCLAPVARVLVDEFGLEYGLMTTTHAYTNDQKILDLPHSDLRRARAAGVSMIPTTTGAAKALALVVPETKGKLDGMAIRVPTPNVSIVDLVALLSKDVTEADLSSAFKTYADGKMKGILGYSDEPLVSIDYNGNPNSSTIDMLSLKVIGGRLVKILSWYDNESGFSNRMSELFGFVAQK